MFWVAGVSAILAAVALGWSLRTLFAAPDPLPVGRDFSVVAVTDGSVERKIPLSVQASWAGGAEIVNRSSGTLTERYAATGTLLQDGDELYSVDLAPIVVATGTVPAFRDLEPGMKGKDVTQLQAMLRTVGASRDAADGRFGPATTTALRTWQESVGLPVTGRLQLGTVVFVPKLPSRISWAEGGVVGSSLAPGTVVGTLLPDEPAFTMALPPNQRGLVESGMSVEISGGQADALWPARLGAIGPAREDGASIAEVVPVRGRDSICGKDCSSIPPEGEADISARVTVVPLKNGPLVPTAALAVGPEGKSAVVSESGERLPVTVLAVAGGQAIVSGVSVGQMVRVPGRAGT